MRRILTLLLVLGGCQPPLTGPGREFRELPLPQTLRQDLSPQSKGPQNITSPPQGITSPPQGITAPPQGITSPPQGFSAATGRIVLPSRLTAPPQGFSLTQVLMPPALAQTNPFDQMALRLNGAPPPSGFVLQNPQNLPGGGASTQYFMPNISVFSGETPEVSLVSQSGDATFLIARLPTAEGTMSVQDITSTTTAIALMQSAQPQLSEFSIQQSPQLATVTQKVEATLQSSPKPDIKADLQAVAREAAALVQPQQVTINNITLQPAARKRPWSTGRSRIPR